MDLMVRTQSVLFGHHVVEPLRRYGAPSGLCLELFSGALLVSLCVVPTAATTLTDGRNGLNGRGQKKTETVTTQYQYWVKFVRGF